MLLLRDARTPAALTPASGSALLLAATQAGNEAAVHQLLAMPADNPAAGGNQTLRHAAQQGCLNVLSVEALLPNPRVDPTLKRCAKLLRPIQSCSRGAGARGSASP